MKLQYIPDYIPLFVKGSGSFGHVIEAKDNIHNCQVAIKRTHKVGPKLSRELEILSKIKECDYVVRLLDVYYTTEDSQKVCQNLVFEYVPQNLDKYMKRIKKMKKHISIKKIKKIAKQLLLGLDYCHKRYIVHRDLKPENILLTEDENAKICDFGSSKIIKYSPNNKDIYDFEENKIKSTPYTVSRYYRAPELFFGKCDYNSKIDIFSIGLIIGELFTLETLFTGINEGMQIIEYINVLGLPKFDYLDQFNMPKKFNHFLKKYKISELYSLQEILNSDHFYNKRDIDEVSDLLYNMLKWDYRERFSAEECLRHKFFS